MRRHCTPELEGLRAFVADAAVSILRTIFSMTRTHMKSTPCVRPDPGLPHQSRTSRTLSYKLTLACLLVIEVHPGPSAWVVVVIHGTQRSCCSNFMSVQLARSHVFATRSLHSFEEILTHKGYQYGMTDQVLDGIWPSSAAY
jgi:hypothetical protein